MVEIGIQKVLHLHKEESKKKPSINSHYMITEKFDGWFCYIDYTPEQGWGYPRNEDRVIPSFMFARDRFINSIPTPRQPIRFIMEAYIPGIPFHVANGIFNRKSEDAKDVKFILHDCIYLDTFFIYGKKENEARERYNILLASGLPFYREVEEIGIAPLLDITDDKSVWMKNFETVTYAGGEGIILKQVDGFYQPNKRNSSLMKIKLEKTFDLLVTDLYETIGEKGNKNINLMLQNKDGKKVPVRVGRDKDVAEFTLNSPIGKVAQIKAMRKLEDGSYREPRYQFLRFDKQPWDID